PLFPAIIKTDKTVKGISDVNWQYQYRFDFLRQQNILGIAFRHLADYGFKGLFILQGNDEISDHFKRQILKLRIVHLSFCSFCSTFHLLVGESLLSVRIKLILEVV